ncbi:MAG: M20 family metallo-hydrolase [Deltaproteobacteria bacterium]|nr:M20 family metallo-hydrolase [Deltaproteobacteria bacterium]
MDLTNRLLARVDSYRQAMIDAQRALVATPALGPDNGGRGEMAKALLVEGWLADLGLELIRVDAPDDRVPDGVRPNLVGRLAGGEGPAVWVLAHLDVVPPGELSLWGGDPWTLRVDGDRLHGRGVQDNHQGLVMGLFAVRALLDEGLAPPGPVGLIAVSDEETGSGYGLDHVLQARRDLFDSRDLIIVPDAGEPDGSLIEVAEKSILWLKVEVTGQQVHASTPDKGVNALYAAARMMVAVRELAARFPQTDPLFTLPRSSFEPTKKEAGVENINTVPGRDVFYVDCRVLPAIPLEEVFAALTAECERIAGEEGASVVLTPVQWLQSPPATPADAPVVEALVRAVARVHGIKAAPGGIGGGTVAAMFRQAGLPAAVWMSCPPTAHMPDEYALISDHLKDTKALALVMAGLA